jgi:hypothetical protein
VIVMTFEAAGYRDVQGRYAKRSANLVAQLRAGVREESRAFVTHLREEAPKRSGLFAGGMHYRTDVTEHGIRSTIYVKGEHAFLLPIIVKGTREHVIPKGGSTAQLAKGYPLRFFWEDGPRGPDIYYFWSVLHPGTEPDDFPQRVLDERWPEMQEMLRKVARSVDYTYEAGTGG